MDLGGPIRSESLIPILIWIDQDVSWARLCSRPDSGKGPMKSYISGEYIHKYTI